jgi:hypothetical protein
MFKQRNDFFRSLLDIRFHQNFEVFRCPRLRVDRYGVSADDEIPNAVCVQNGQEFSVI